LLAGTGTVIKIDPYRPTHTGHIPRQTNLRDLESSQHNHGPYTVFSASRRQGAKNRFHPPEDKKFFRQMVEAAKADWQALK
jgi:hypothetical protein